MKKFTTVLVIFISILLINSVIASEDITGKWEGKLVPAPGSELTIHFLIDKNDDGTYSVVLNSPDQGAIKDIKASSVVFDSGKLNLDVTDLSGSYEGVLKNGQFEGNWMQEGTSIPLNLSPYKKPVLTEEDKAKLLGQWHGQLEMPTGTNTLVFRFEMQEKSIFKGFLDLPDFGGKDLPVTDVELDEANIKFKIPNAGAEYKGKLAEKEIVGEIKIGGQPYPVTLTKGEYKAPTYSLNLPEETKDLLTGEWHGNLKMPTMNLHVEFRFETTEKGEFVGAYGMPDRNMKGIPIKEGNIVDGQLVLKIAVVNAEYKGKLEGDKLTGEWVQPGMSNVPLTLKKGEYVPPVYNLDLPKETKEGLSGQWHGQLKTPTAIIHVALRFETTEKGEFLGFHDVPDQNVKGLQVFEANLSDGMLTLKAPNVEFKGELTGDELTGEWFQLASRTRIPITLKKGEYVPPVYNLDLPKETKELLSGEWHGEFKAPQATVTVVFRFETTEQGEFVGFEDVPDSGRKGIQIYEANLSDGMLTLKVAGAEFKGQLEGEELTGEVVQPGRTFPFTIKKGKYIPTVYILNLSKETMEILSGKWQGKLGNLTLILTFEKNEKGDFVGAIEIPERKQKGIPITEASFSNGQLILKEKLANAEIAGELSDDVFDAEWIQREYKTPITFKKE